MHTIKKTHPNGDVRYEIAHGTNRYIVSLSRDQACDRASVVQAIRRARKAVRK